MYTTLAKRAVLAVLPAALLTACVSQSKYDALQSQNQQLQAQNQNQQQQIATLNQQVNKLQSAIKYTVNSDLLFQPGSWQLSSNGQTLMGRLASQLAPSQTRHIVINGYTDNAPVGPALRKQGVDSNNALSEKRAQSVMNFLSSQGVKAEFMTAKGWGDANPIASNSTPQGRAQNRRVEITFANEQASQL